MNYISRIVVEEGFLDGLDIELRPGLNAIIGPRGSGKTSIIELVRFALGIKSADETLNRRAEDLAVGILQSGRVTVYVACGSQTLRISRSPGQQVTEGVEPLRTPLIFSQQEIERVGLDPLGRLTILDALMPEEDSRPEDELGLVAKTRSLTVEISGLRAEVGQLDDELTVYKDAEAQVTEAETVQAQLLAEVTEAAPEKEALDRLAIATAENTLRQRLFVQASQNVKAWRGEVARIAEGPGLPTWPPNAGTPDLLAEPRVAFDRMNMALADLHRQAADLAQTLVDELNPDPARR